MKDNVHPKWYPDAKITCACGNTFKIGSTKPEIQVDICSKCHPFYTGEIRFVDTQGRVERFQTRQKATQGKTYIKKKDKRNKEEKETREPKTLKEMLQGKS